MNRNPTELKKYVVKEHDENKNFIIQRSAIQISSRYTVIYNIIVLLFLQFNYFIWLSGYSSVFIL